MRKILKVLSLSMIMTAMALTSAMAEEAIPTASTVLVNGNKVEFDAYNINGNNYFKLRDIAYALSGTDCQFDVGYNSEANAISLTSGEGYTIAGGEMSKSISVNYDASLTDSKIIKDGEAASFTAYNINGNNYFKLRDVGESFGFSVNWDEETSSIMIDTKKGVDDMDGDYFSTLNVGDSVELVCTLKDVGDNLDNRFYNDRYYFIIGRFESEKGDFNAVLHTCDDIKYGQKSDYEPYVGGQVLVTGVYEGYSKLYKIPFLSLYELTDIKNHSSVSGIRKAEERVKEEGRGEEKVFDADFRNIQLDIIEGCGVID